MNKKDVFCFLKKCDSELDAHSKVFFFSIDSEVQKKSITDLGEMKEKAELILKESQSQNFEDTSNLLCGLICHICCLESEIQMYLHMKNGEMSDAWDVLINAQNYARSAMRAHSIHRKTCGVRFAHLESLEKLLFPPQIFVSPGAISKSSECSICKAEYTACNHIAGRIYNGVFCCKIITHATLAEVAVVKDPANKKCRIVNFDKGNISYDKLTLRKITKENNP